jgi:hypothetical protein
MKPDRGAYSIPALELSPVSDAVAALTYGSREPCLGRDQHQPAEVGRGSKGFGKGCSTRMRLAVSRL